jgi:(1->4)-alpha-D-glucan 1-alpha-D-glucosylmutase
MGFDTRLTATYRMQFHKGFGFGDAARRANYLRALGVSHLYASPIMKAVAGSLHGYDVTDFAVVNPELGGEAGFRDMAAAFRAVGIGIIVDIVPNHMAVGGADNPYWLDLLEKGRDSAYADFFDVDFDASGLNGKILAPFLGDSYDKVLESGDLAIRPRADNSAFAIFYNEHCFPLRDVDQQTLRAEGEQAFADPAKLHELLEAQHYRLASWRTANDILNFRRFFEITTLAGVCIERGEAFDKVHAVPLAFYGEGLIDGVRVDHIDGLTDPAGYLQRLRAALDGRRAERPERRRGDAYVVVEKILAGEEPLPRWPIQGTTGYDFMNEVSMLQHDETGAAPLRAYWGALSGRPAEFEVEEDLARVEMLERNFVGQLDSLVETLHAAAFALTGDRDLTRGALKRAVVAVIRNLRVYRSYARGGLHNTGAGEALALAFERAGRAPTRDDPALAMLRAIVESRSDHAAVAEAIRRLHQLCAPVAAKSVEDTAFYRHSPLISRNDVGFDAARMSLSVEAFHARMQARAGDWPHAMLATATHDHKRGEDARARLAVLSEIPDVWIARARTWSALNQALRADGFNVADEYALFQTLVGAWPPALAANDRAGLAAFAERVAGWQVKALREAKLRSSWLTPNADYERGAERYVSAALDPSRSGAFLNDLVDFVLALAPAGFSNALVQTSLRCLLPGVPDLYQGSELWDFTLVDPDNRRPVDFGARERLLKEGGDLASGAVKQTLIRRLLALRRQMPDLFALGDYAPIAVDAPLPVLAFMRRRGEETVLAAVALGVGRASLGTGRLIPAPQVWGDARLAFDVSGFASAFGDAKGIAHPRLADLFRQSPVAVFARQPPSVRPASSDGLISGV